MSVFDALFGSTRRAKPKMDPLFALPTALVDLESAGITPLGVGGLCVREPEGGSFQVAVGEIVSVLELYQKEHTLSLATPSDGLGFAWWVLTASDTSLDDVTTGVHMVGEELRQRGYGDALVAAAFPLDEAREGEFTLIYNYRRGLYYPFAPLPGRHERDNARELRLSGVLPKSLPREEEIDRWYALWDAPLRRQPKGGA
jgi:hypothetical protein